MNHFARELLGLSAACLLGTSAFAQSANDFYKGRDMKFVVPAGPGGGYAFEGLLLSKTLSKYLPGNPTIVPQYMPGAGGATAAAYLYSVAPQDGSVIGMLLPDIAQSQAMNPTTTRYDVAKFNWLGRTSPLRSALVVWHSAPATDLAGMRAREVILAAVGKTSVTYTEPALMKAIMGTKFKILIGYRGAADAMLAMERGEVHGWAASWEVVKNSKPTWVQEKKIVPVVQLSLTPIPDISDVPMLPDLIDDPSKKRMAEFMLFAAELGHIVLAPPNVPADRLAALRIALMEALKDPELLEAARKQGQTIEPASHEVVEKLIEKTLSTPADLVGKVQNAISEN